MVSLDKAISPYPNSLDRPSFASKHFPRTGTQRIERPGVDMLMMWWQSETENRIADPVRSWTATCPGRSSARWREAHRRKRRGGGPCYDSGIVQDSCCCHGHQGCGPPTMTTAWPAGDRITLLAVLGAARLNWTRSQTRCGYSNYQEAPLDGGWDSGNM